MKNIWLKIKFDNTLYIFLILIIISGMFKEFTFVFILIFFHELGHALTGIFLKWKVVSITFYPYGGLTKFFNSQNSSLNEEILILLMGPVVQTLVYLMLIKFFKYPYIRTYHLSILFFNLLPILNLDGGKLLNIFFNKIFNYLVSFYLSLWVSFFSVFFLIIYAIFNYYNFNLFLMGIFMFFKLISSYKDLKYSYHKFLLERYLYNYSFKKKKVIKNIYGFYKECYHYISFREEKDYLKKYFSNKN